MAKAARQTGNLRYVIIVAALVVVGAAAWLAPRVMPNVAGPGGEFQRHTGLRWPREARIVRTDDSHGGFHGDGEFYLVFDGSPETINEWLAGAAPWGEWQRGPVPGVIGFHCRFGSDGVSFGGPVEEPKQYFGDRELVQLLSSDQIWYCAHERGSGGLRWHNGNLLIIDARAGRVWLCVWDC